MNYVIKRTTQFKKDVKLMLKQGKDIQALLDIVELLRTDAPLPDRCHDPALSGKLVRETGMPHRSRLASDL